MTKTKLNAIKRDLKALLAKYDITLEVRIEGDGFAITDFGVLDNTEPMYQFKVLHFHSAELCADDL